MKRPEQSPAQQMSNSLGDVQFGDGNSVFTFAPVQIGTQIETQVIQISVEAITQRPLICSSPYLGLRRFNVADRDRFFGRDGLIQKLRDGVNQNDFSLVLGASGSGKSSLVRAGVIPELKQSLAGGSLYDFIFTPGRDPFESLYRCVLNEEKEFHFSEQQAVLVRSGQVGGLNQFIQQYQKPQTSWLFFIDQFEELFTTCPDGACRHRFIEELVQVIQARHSSVRVLLAMRADFLEQLSHYPALGQIVNQNIMHLVTEMHPDELRQAIEQPAARHGVVFEEGLVEQIIKEVQGQSGYLPLLQYTLNLLWETEAKTIAPTGTTTHLEQRVLTRRSYNALEGVRGTLQTRISNLYQALNQDEQTLTKQIFLRLVNIVETDSGSRAVSRRAYREEFSAPMEIILDQFIAENLLVSNSEYREQRSEKAGSSASDPPHATVEIAHEILLSSWVDLKRWLEEEREAIILKNWLMAEVQRWHKIQQLDSAKANEELLKGSRLEQIVALRDAHAFAKLGGLSSLEQEYVNASVTWRNTLQQQAEERRRRQLQQARRVAIVTGLTSLVVTGLALFAGFQWRSVRLQQQQTTIREIRALAAAADSRLSASQEFDDLDSLLKALLAARTLQQVTDPDPELIALVTRTLHQVVYGIHERTRFIGHDGGWLLNLAISPDGQYVATASFDGTARLWNFQGQQLAIFQSTDHIGFQGVESGIFAVIFHPRLPQVITVGGDGFVRFWDLQGTQIFSFQASEVPIFDAVLNEDGSQLITGAADGVVRSFDLLGQPLTEFAAHYGPISELQFSPDWTQLATAGVNDGRIRLWDLSDTENPQLEVDSNLDASSAQGVDFSPDGRWFVGGFDRQSNGVPIWDMAGNLLRILPEHRGVSGVTFSPSGQWIATASNGNAVRLWNTSNGILFTELGHQGAANVVRFSPVNEAVVITGEQENNIAHLWDLSSKEEVSLSYSGNVPIFSASFSPDGHQVITGDEDGRVQVWNLDGTLSTEFRADEIVFRACLSPDGTQVVVHNGAGHIQLWNLEGVLESEIIRVPGQRTTFEFRSGEILVAIASPDEDVQILRLSDQQQLHHFAIDPENPIDFLRFSPDASKLAIADVQGKVTVWTLDGSFLHEFQSLPRIKQMQFSPDSNQLAILDFEYYTSIYDLETTTSGDTELLRVRNGEAYKIHFSPDGQWLATVGDGITLWDLNSGQPIAFYEDPAGTIQGFGFSPDSRQFIATGVGMARIWRVETFDTLLSRGCAWIRDYLYNPLAPLSEAERRVCDGIEV